MPMPICKLLLVRSFLVGEIKMTESIILQHHVCDYAVLNMRFRSWLCLHAAPPPSIL